MVAIRSGWKTGGRLPWNVTAICKTFKISCLMRRHLMRGGSEHHHKPGYSVWSNGWISPYFGERLVATASVRLKSLARQIPWTRVTRWGNLERRHLGRGRWGIGEDGRIWNPCKKTQRKGSVNAHELWKIHIINRRWNGKTLWRRSGSENTHLNPGSPRPRRRTWKSSRRIRRVFFNPTSRLIVVWWWSWKGFVVQFRELHLPSSR